MKWFAPLGCFRDRRRDPEGDCSGVRGHPHIELGGRKKQAFPDIAPASLGAVRRGPPGGAGTPACAMQYRDYIVWYGSDATAQARREARRYWALTLADGPAAVDLPTRRPRPAQRSDRARSLAAAIDAALLGRIKRVSATANATPFHFLMAAAMVWLHRITGQRCIVIGVPVAGQLATDLQPLAGCERLLGHSCDRRRGLPLRRAARRRQAQSAGGPGARGLHLRRAGSGPESAPRPGGRAARCRHPEPERHPGDALGRPAG